MSRTSFPDQPVETQQPHWVARAKGALADRACTARMLHEDQLADRTVFCTVLGIVNSVVLSTNIVDRRLIENSARVSGARCRRQGGGIARSEAVSALGVPGGATAILAAPIHHLGTSGGSPRR